MLGPQGSGKGTQAALLSRHFHIPHISTGEVLRHEMAEKTPLGKRITATMNAGILIDDHETNSVMRHRLSDADCRFGWISDGYPRRMGQAKPMLKFARPNVIVLLNLTNADAIRRLSGRRVCPNGHVYHLRHDPPKKRRGFCDHDGLKLKVRDDDTPSAIRKRLRWHHAETGPMIHWFRSQVPMIAIDARPSISIVYRSILKELRKFSWQLPPAPPTSRR